jgi:hypothetical protein
MTDKSLRTAVAPPEGRPSAKMMTAIPSEQIGRMMSRVEAAETWPREHVGAKCVGDLARKTFDSQTQSTIVWIVAPTRRAILQGRFNVEPKPIETSLAGSLRT